MPGRLRDPRPHARGARDQAGGEPGAPRQSREALRAGGGRAAGAVQSRSRARADATGCLGRLPTDLVGGGGEPARRAGGRARRPARPDRVPRRARRRKLRAASRPLAGGGGRPGAARVRPVRAGGALGGEPHLVRRERDPRLRPRGGGPRRRIRRRLPGDLDLAGRARAQVRREPLLPRRRPREARLRRPAALPHGRERRRVGLRPTRVRDVPRTRDGACDPRERVGEGAAGRARERAGAVLPRARRGAGRRPGGRGGPPRPRVRAGAAQPGAPRRRRERAPERDGRARGGQPPELRGGEHREDGSVRRRVDARPRVLLPRGGRVRGGDGPRRARPRAPP